MTWGEVDYFTETGINLEILMLKIGGDDFGGYVSAKGG